MKVRMKLNEDLIKMKSVLVILNFEDHLFEKIKMVAYIINL